MATNWDLYQNRLNINGSTQRDRNIKFKTRKKKYMYDYLRSLGICHDLRVKTLSYF